MESWNGKQLGRPNTSVEWNVTDFLVLSMQSQSQFYLSHASEGAVEATSETPDAIDEYKPLSHVDQMLGGYQEVQGEVLNILRLLEK